MVSGYSSSKVLYEGTNVSSLFPQGDKLSQYNLCKIKFLAK